MKHDEDCSCYGDKVEHDKDCANCSCQIKSTSDARQEAMIDRLEDIEARLAHATTFNEPMEDLYGGYDGAIFVKAVSGPEYELSIDDTKFLAHAPTDLAYLLARLKAAEAVCEVAEFLFNKKHWKVPHVCCLCEWCRLNGVLTTWRRSKNETDQTA